MYSIYKKLRDSRGMKDADVALLAGIRQGVLSDWKSGKSMPGIKNLQKIAQVFNVSIDYLLTGKQSEYSIRLSEEELWMIGQYRQCDDLTRSMVNRLLMYRKKEGETHDD